jgi:HSP20 family protein
MVLVTQYVHRPFAPPTDVIELSDRLLVLVEIAGMRSDDLKIALLNRHLVISGFRERPQLSGSAYHQVEIIFGEFRVEIALPWPVERDAVQAAYNNGFLQVELPRELPRQIPVTGLNRSEEQDEPKS